MFLKRVVLQGFKSFADRTEFDFGAGLTGIVGPNGCGKSNVVDAIRWVLGEQSPRSLRGGRMADVIFAGSRSRKPATFAQVELTFDNRAGILRSDDEEVVVGRVLYADGESAYRLNGNACRLKDIRELLLDTGVGVDAYSIIEQGRVDLLLQASPVERREIFEEAAGISRYKVRRAEAQRRLERTQNNLLRMQDVLDELERRLRSVKLAAGKARSFQEYDARLRELRSSYGMAEYHELEQKRLVVLAEIQDCSAALQAERSALASQDAAAAEHQHELQSLDEQIQAVEAQVLELQTSLSALGERIEQGERRVADLHAMHERRERQGAGLGERLAALRQRMESEEAGLAALRAEEQHSACRIVDVNAARKSTEQRAAGSRDRLEREKLAAFEAVRRAALLQNEQSNLQQQERRLRGEVERLAMRRRSLGREEEELAERLDRLDERLQELEQRGAELKRTLRAEEERLAQLVDQARELDDQASSLKQSRSAVMSRLGLLEDMERRLEGVDRGTQTVLSWREEPLLQGVIVGLVADVLHIDDPRVAILQPVLAAFETHVLVRDMATFIQVLNERAEQVGPVRVLALERLAVRPPGTPGPATAAPAGGYRDAPGFVARAADWVNCSAESRPLAEHLLGRVVIVDTVERALRFAQDALAGHVFVSLDGWTVGVDGRLTYGSAGMTPGLISRKAEARQLRAELDELEVHLEQVLRHRAMLGQSISDAELRKEAVLEQIATTQREQAELRGERLRSEGERQRFEREAGAIDGELGEATRVLNGVLAQGRQLEHDCELTVAAQQEHESEIELLGRELDELERALARLAEQHTEALLRRERAAEKRAAGEEALKELRQGLQTVEAERAEALREVGEAQRQIEAAGHELEEARRRREALRAECEQAQASGLRLREQRQRQRQRIEECGATARASQRRIEAGESSMHGRQVTLRELEVRKEDLAARVQDELGLELEQLYASYEHHEQDWQAVSAEIEDLRGKIARLGNVNLDALGELEELAPRHEQLVSQRDDLRQAIDRLQALITELDQESRARFTATFEHVRGHFQEMFRKLFGGGKADIILQEPENPLECGIDIIARPPGKEPQSISLLSGGEKTLTAVALLMGVFKSRPSPFAILDEVDAALDEANIERFNMLLHEFLSQSQFVVITHSKRTMACVDVLYGITMEEPGVSKRVGVRFEDRVKTPSVA